MRIAGKKYTQSFPLSQFKTQLGEGRSSLLHNSSKGNAIHPLCLSLANKEKDTPPKVLSELMGLV